MGAFKEVTSRALSEITFRSDAIIASGLQATLLLGNT